MEAALLPPHALGADLSDYRKELVLSLSSASEHAVKSLTEAQKPIQKVVQQVGQDSHFAMWRLGHHPFPPQ